VVSHTGGGHDRLSNGHSLPENIEHDPNSSVDHFVRIFGD